MELKILVKLWEKKQILKCIKLDVINITLYIVPVLCQKNAN